MERTIDTIISAQGLADTSGSARIHDLSREAKTARATKAAGVCVAIGVGSLLIPLVHFVLPWFMLIVAAVVFKRVAGQGAMLVEATGPCPKCGEIITIGEQPLEWPLEWNCEGCRKSTSTRPASADEAPSAAE